MNESFHCWFLCRNVASNNNLFGGGFGHGHDGTENDTDADVQSSKKSKFHSGFEHGQHFGGTHGRLNAPEDESKKSLRVNDTNGAKEGRTAGGSGVGSFKIDFGTETGEDNKNGNHWNESGGFFGIIKNLVDVVHLFLHCVVLFFLTVVGDWFRTVCFLFVLCDHCQFTFDADDELNKNDTVVQSNKTQGSLHGGGETGFFTNV